jgi:hypothetical protein
MRALRRVICATAPLAVATLLCSATPARADVWSAHDAWAGDVDQEHENDEPVAEQMGVDFWGIALTEGTYEDPVELGVQAHFEAPTAQTVSYGEEFNYAPYVHSDLYVFVTFAFWPEGEWGLISYHYYAQALFASLLSRIYWRKAATRYFLVGEASPGNWFWNRDNCFSSCQQATWYTSRAPTLYYAGYGWFIMFPYVGPKCAIKHQFQSGPGWCYG